MLFWSGLAVPKPDLRPCALALHTPKNISTSARIKAGAARLPRTALRYLTSGLVRGGACGASKGPAASEAGRRRGRLRLARVTQTRSDCKTCRTACALTEQSARDWERSRGGKAVSSRPAAADELTYYRISWMNFWLRWRRQEFDHRRVTNWKKYFFCSIWCPSPEEHGSFLVDKTS